MNQMNSFSRKGQKKRHEQSQLHPKRSVATAMLQSE